MSKTLKQIFMESFIGSNGKVDHKRLTTFAFVIMFFFTTIMVLFNNNKLKNPSLIDTVLITMASVIVGGMGLTKIPTKTKTTNYETEQKLYSGGDA
jgi:hypothetical protein